MDCQSGNEGKAHSGCNTLIYDKNFGIPYPLQVNNNRARSKELCLGFFELLTSTLAFEIRDTVDIHTEL